MAMKGQVLIMRVMMAVNILIAVVIISPAVLEAINTGSTGLSCDSATDTVLIAACTVIDITIFHIIGIGLAVSLAFAAGRKDVGGVVTGISVFIITTVLISPLKSIIIIGRDASHLNCGAGGLTIGNSMACLALDIWLFWFVVTILAGIFSYMIADKIKNE